MPLQIGEFSAWIADEAGTPLPEYSATLDGRQATCWIPSEAGKHFSVRWRDARVSSSTSGRVYLDGFRCPGTLIKHPHHQPGHEAYMSSVKTSATTRRRPAFAQIELTEDDSLLDGPAHSESLGEIRLDVVRVRLLEPSMGKPVDVPGAYKVHERAKKMGGHCVNFGADEPHPSSGSFKVKDLEKMPAATFVFRYRPLDLLKAQGIAPSDARAPHEPLAGPSTNKRKVSASTEPAVKKEPQDRRHPVKAEDVADEDIIDLTLDTSAPRKRVKREPGSLTHRGVFVSGEVIDLT